MMSSKLQRWAANKLDMRVAPRAEESQKAQMVTDKMRCTCCLAEIGDRADLTYTLPY
jgi:hypothetical protein